MLQTVATTLSLLGAIFLMLASVGILRLPDVYCRISAVTKAATLGLGCLLLAVMIHFSDLRVTTRILAIITFVFLTSPVAAQSLGRAAYVRGVPLWTGTSRDELRTAGNSGSEDAAT